MFIFSRFAPQNGIRLICQFSMAELAAIHCEISQQSGHALRAGIIVSVSVCETSFERSLGGSRPGFFVLYRGFGIEHSFPDHRFDSFDDRLRLRDGAAWLSSRVQLPRRQYAFFL
ncbi:hypothetical protein [Burkholderia arboris]|uniref:hypothetical protein n=1 Tax=Burkholderia arboris TaxID=488730 RepID=UPI0030F2B1D1